MYKNQQSMASALKDYNSSVNKLLIYFLSKNHQVKDTFFYFSNIYSKITVNNWNNSNNVIMLHTLTSSESIYWVKYNFYKNLLFTEIQTNEKQWKKMRLCIKQVELWKRLCWKVLLIFFRYFRKSPPIRSYL